jgi:hypothetical protein
MPFLLLTVDFAPPVPLDVESTVLLVEVFEVLLPLPFALEPT